MDINIALTRAGIFLVVYSLILGVPFWMGYVTKSWFFSTLFAVVLCTLGPFVYQELRRRAEEILLKEQKQYQKALLEISSTMLLLKELDRLLKSVAQKIVDTVKVSWVGIYLQDEKAKKYTLRHFSSLRPEVSAPPEFAQDSFIVNRLKDSRLPVHGEELEIANPKTGLAVPYIVDEALLGFMLLGEKPKNSFYTQDDINVFTVLANQIALAIENCQFYVLERGRQHSLRLASLDRQMACMAHEIDNPNHALLSTLGSLEIIIDELKDNIPPEKLEYIKQKLSRAKFNSSRISKMISAVRDFSKTTTGELKPVNLKWIVDDFLSILQPQLKYYNVTFTEYVPEEPVWLEANKIEIEQVLVNLGTNAVQAINEAQGEKREITLKAYRKDAHTLRIDFSDTGAGISKELLEDIFLDFVTTKASSVGTGLGLSISRKIISKHKGKIWAESQEDGKGAMFHIEMPIMVGLTEEEKTKAQQEQHKDKRILF